MDKTRAFHQLVHSYPLGTAALAAAMGMSATTLLHKANPADVRQFFSPEEGLRLQEVCGSVAPAVVECERLGLLTFKRPSAQVEPMCARQVNKTVQEFSEFLAKATEALADGAVTANELAHAQAECLDAIGAIQDLLAALTTLHERGVPGFAKEQQA